jgi:uncharacterized DUF497 family protein
MRLYEEKISGGFLTISVYTIMRMFSRDSPKALLNYEKHKVSFDEALTVFVDEWALDWKDLLHSQVEKRHKRIGKSIMNRILIVVYTTRRLKDGKETVRIISAHGKQAAKSVKHMPDKNIDYSDIPESTDEELKRARRVGRPSTGNAKQLIAIRISPRVLDKLRKMAAKLGKPYQTLINELLEKATGKVA